MSTAALAISCRSLAAAGLPHEPRETRNKRQDHSGKADDCLFTEINPGEFLEHQARVESEMLLVHGVVDRTGLRVEVEMERFVFGSSLGQLRMPDAASHDPEVANDLTPLAPGR